MGHGPPPGPGTGNAATPKKRRKKSRITPARQNPLQQAESPSTKRTLVPAPFPLALFEKTAKAGNPIASVPAMPCRQGGYSSNYAKNLLMRHGAEQPQTCPNLAAPLFHTTGTPAARPPHQSISCGGEARERASFKKPFPRPSFTPSAIYCGARRVLQDIRDALRNRTQRPFQRTRRPCRNRPFQTTRGTDCSMRARSRAAFQWPFR